MPAACKRSYECVLHAIDAAEAASVGGRPVHGMIEVCLFEICPAGYYLFCVLASVDWQQAAVI